MGSQSVIYGIVVCLCVLTLCTLVMAETGLNQTAAESNLTNNSVLITNFAFEPHQLNVTVNSSVIWTNEDTAPHNIVSDTGAPAEIKSDLFSKGQTFEFNFTQAGSYPYHCGVHPSMTGVIQVTV
jgi:plastocyanin